MATNSEALRKRIEAGKFTAKDKYAVCKVAARRLVSAHTALVEAEESRDIKNNTKSIAKYARAESVFNAAKKEYISFVKLYDSLVEEVLSLYDELIASESAKGAKRARLEAEKFESRESYLRDCLSEIVKEIDGLEAEEELPVAKKPEPEQKKQRTEPISQQPNEEIHDIHVPPQHHTTYGMPYYMPNEMYRPYAPQGVNIAPASIDISAIVEDAVASAMEKFKKAFNKRAEEFIEAQPIGEDVSASAETEVPGAVLLMEEEVAENEKAVVEKLSALIENLKVLSLEMTELGAAYMQLANTQKDAVDAQRKVNDMQRHISRDIQGVQANQKVINQDQAAVSAEQAAVIEQQKANVENQKLLEGAQLEITEMQKSLLEAQKALEESVREVIASQKSIISGQQSVIASNAKNIELQRELTEKQTEVSALQKSAIAEHKQLARSLRSKNKARNQQNPISTEANKIIENADSADKIPLPEEVELDELKVEN